VTQNDLKYYLNLSSVHVAIPKDRLHERHLNISDT